MYAKHAYFFLANPLTHRFRYYILAFAATHAYFSPCCSASLANDAVESKQLEFNWAVSMAGLFFFLSSELIHFIRGLETPYPFTTKIPIFQNITDVQQSECEKTSKKGSV